MDSILHSEEPYEGCEAAARGDIGSDMFMDEGFIEL